MSGDRDQVLEKDRKRYLMLRKVYDASAGQRTRAMVEFFKIAAAAGIDEEEAEDTYNYLEGEGLIAARALGGIVELTHHGQKEVEDSIRRPERDTDHFSSIVLRAAIEQHFHGPVGAVQTGDSSTAHVVQNVGSIVADVDKLLVALAPHLNGLSADDRREAEDYLEGIKTEAGLATPSKPRMRALAHAAKDFLLGAGAGAAGNLLSQFISGLS